MSMNERKWAAKTIRKKNIVFSSKFSLIAEKAINAVRLSDFLNVCDAIHARGEYAALDDFCELSEAIMLFARMRGIIKYDVFDGIRLLSRYSVPASDVDTAILIKHIDWRDDKI